MAGDAERRSMSKEDRMSERKASMQAGDSQQDLCARRERPPRSRQLRPSCERCEEERTDAESGTGSGGSRASWGSLRDATHRTALADDTVRALNFVRDEPINRDGVLRRELDALTAIIDNKVSEINGKIEQLARELSCPRRYVTSSR